LKTFRWVNLEALQLYNPPYDSKRMVNVWHHRWRKGHLTENI
jgi:hypothetical protein